MTQTVVVIDPSDGSEVDYTANYRPDKGMEIGGEAFNGETDSGGEIVLDDTAGTIVNRDDLAHGRRIIIREDASGGTVPLHMGRISPRSQYRDIEKANRARSITVVTRDQNAELSGIVVDGWSRPAEEPFERIQALLAAYLNGSSSTATNADASNGIWGRDSTVIGDAFVNTTPIGYDMPAKEYVETDPREVIRDCCEWAGFDAFVILNDDETLDLFFDDRTGTAYTSTLSISDNHTQVDGTACFEPIWDLGAAHELEGSEQATGILLIGANETRTYDNRPAVEDVNDKWEYVDRSDATVQADLNNNIVAMLNARQEEELRIQFSMRVPAELVHLIRPGMRMEVKRAYAAGIGTSTYFRAVQVRYRWLTHEYYMVGVHLGYPVKLVRRYGQGRTVPTPPTPSTDGSTVRLYPSAHESGDADTAESMAAPSLTGGDRDGGWEGIGLGVYNYMYDTPASSTSNTTLTWDAVNAAAGQYMTDGLVHILDGDLLSIIQSGGTVRGQFLARSRYGIGVSEAAQNNTAAWGIRVYRSGSGFVQTLLSVQAGGSAAFPASATLVNRAWSATIPAYAGAQPGDFVVVEIGTNHVDPTTGATGVGIRYEDTAATDLPEDELETEGRNAWIEFRAASGTGDAPNPIVLPGDEEFGEPGCYAPCGHTHAHGFLAGDDIHMHDADQIEGLEEQTLMTFEEEDGTPSGSFSTIKVPNGSMTDNDDGTASLAWATSVHAHDPATPGFHGVLVHRSTNFTTTFSNDSIPDFDNAIYDTDGLWEGVTNPERLTIPAAWDGLVAIFHARGGWSGHSDDYVEMKLYKNGTSSEANLIAVTQHATNIASPFQELTSPPIPVAEGDYFTITFKTPDSRTLIEYDTASILFGAYLVGSGGGESGEVTEADVRDAGRWEVVVSGTAPPVAVTNEAEDDWLYSWVSGP